MSEHGAVFPSPVAQYALAVFGSAAVEFAALLKELSASHGVLPAKWKTRAYPLVRILFAVVFAGPLAIILDASSTISAIYIGISAPLIFDRAAAGLKISNGHTDPGQ